MSSEAFNEDARVAHINFGARVVTINNYCVAHPGQWLSVPEARLLLQETYGIIEPDTHISSAFKNLARNHNHLVLREGKIRAESEEMRADRLAQEEQGLKMKATEERLRDLSALNKAKARYDLAHQESAKAARKLGDLQRELFSKYGCRIDQT